MIEHAHRSASPVARFGGQPIAIAAAALVLVVLGVGSIAAWRSYTGNAPETDRVVATWQLQGPYRPGVRATGRETKGLEATQQESIDQLQVVQDQLLTVRRPLAAQQADTRRLSEQVTTLTESIDGLRQSFASAQASEPATPQVSRKRSAKGKSNGVKKANRSRGKSRA